MSPKHHPIDQNQGMLLSTERITTGETDPTMQKMVEKYDLAPEGVYPEAATVSPVVTTEGFPVDAVREAVKTKNRRDGQVGKHSPLQREGAYADLEHGVSYVKPGDVLPNFGVVTYTNLAAAEQQAYELERQRQSRR